MVDGLDDVSALIWCVNFWQDQYMRSAAILPVSVAPSGVSSNLARAAVQAGRRPIRITGIRATMQLATRNFRIITKLQSSVPATTAGRAGSDTPAFIRAPAMQPRRAAGAAAAHASRPPRAPLRSEYMYTQYSGRFLAAPRLTVQAD
jgi:hypothetical protein